jgi:hypothetical protein
MPRPAGVFLSNQSPASREKVVDNKQLTPAHAAEYRFLKQQVDQRMDEAFQRDASPDAKQRLEYARQELRDFVSARRREGINI